MSSFIAQCIAGEVLLDDIDDFISIWHEGESNVPLHEFLGMRKMEYSLWLSNPNALPYIIKGHRNNMSVQDALKSSDNFAMAARSSNSDNQKLLDWLKERGFLD